MLRQRTHSLSNVDPGEGISDGISVARSHQSLNFMTIAQKY
jgi:hypothetical protein